MTAVGWALGLALFLAARLVAARALGLPPPRLAPREGSFGRRLVVAVAGSAILWLGATTLMMLEYRVHGVPATGYEPIIVGVMPGGGGEIAGLAVGDEIVSIGGEPVRGVSHVVETVNGTAGTPFFVEIERDGARRVVTAQAHESNGRWRIGVELDQKLHHSLCDLRCAVKRAAMFPADESKRIFRGLGHLVNGTGRAEFSGPVGLVVMGQRQQNGWDPTLGRFAIAFVWLALLGLVVGLAMLILGPRRRRA